MERTEDLTTFVKLSEVYSLRAKQAKEEDVFTRVDEIERARAEDDRDLLLRNLVQKEDSKNSPN